MSTAVHFGAGNIGRGFIGLLLRQAGYAVTFVDISASLVAALEREGRYTVRFVGGIPPPVTVTGIRAISVSDPDAVAKAVAEADIITTAVSAPALAAVAPTIAAGLLARAPAATPAVVIACENQINAGDTLRKLVVAALPSGQPLRAIFPNCAVDRIVPLQGADPADPLGVLVEPYAEWIIETASFGSQPTPTLPSALFVPDISPYIARKLFIVNTGHAAIAYLGYQAGCRHIHEAIALPELYALTESALRESASGLAARYGLPIAVLEDYLRLTLARFTMSGLIDEITRVARQPRRKLGPQERLIAPARQAFSAGIVPRSLARIITAALRYDSSTDPDAVALQAALRAQGVSHVLTQLCELPPTDPLHQLILEHSSSPILRTSSALSPIQLVGQPASIGVAIGRAVHCRASSVATRSAPAGTPDEENARLSAAIVQVSADLISLRDQTIGRLGSAKAEIFEVHLAFLQDPEFIGEARNQLKIPGVTASAALTVAGQVFLDALEQSGDDTLISRASDLRDVTQRLHDVLSCTQSGIPHAYGKDVIVIASELTPSDTAQLNPDHIKGIVTAGGSVTSHSAILARAIGIPAVIGLNGAMEAIPEGAELYLDGSTGEVIVHPPPAAIENARRRQTAHRAETSALARFAFLPGRTADGRPLALAANLGRLGEVSTALAQGAEGIGLFRSEFSYLDRSELPSEEELYELYRTVLMQMAPHPVIVRTLDLGGDKQIPGLAMPKEENPFLGVRGLRLCLAHGPLFRTQLRALLRASAHGQLKIMLPMVTSPSEVRTVRKWLSEERACLESAGHSMAANIPLGIMIEVPAAALMADNFAREVDFFSIGTNDLTQYVMAADRMDPRLIPFQAAHHPAVLRLIQHTVDAAHRHGKWVGLCGEMGSDPVALPLLDGLCLDEISLQPNAITRTRAALCQLDHTANVRLARHCIGLETAEQVAAAAVA